MTDTKISIRPVIKNIGSNKNKNEAESFQNSTLRLILKLQHELIVAFFEHYVRKKKIDFQGLSSLQKNDLMSNVFRNDNMFKTELRGMIIGQFTVNEFDLYQNIYADTNKRILTMAKERLLSVFL